MRNALLSSPAMSSQLYNIGNNEVQMPYLDVLMQMESKGINVRGGTSFSMESKIFNNDNQLRDGAFAIPYQSHINSHLQDYQSEDSNCDINFQQSMSITNKLGLSGFEQGTPNFQNGRKREGEVKSLNGTSDFNEWKKRNKRKKTSSSVGHLQSHHQMTEAVKEIQECMLHMPIRRSQKLSDKITVLQKLVSPFGKTDTASVLQEASLYIKLLQEQIQNLFQMLSSSYSSLRAIHAQETVKKQQDLRSRGLCLVPISFTQKVTKEDQISADNSLSRKSIISINF